MKYTVDYFIKKFKAIPSNKWTTGQYKKANKYCAYGHCGFKLNSGGHEIYTDEGTALYELFNRYNLLIHEVNDGDVKKYSQKNPKARILAALKDIKTS